MKIRFDEGGFGTDGNRVGWDEVVALGIRTTADGPVLDDVYWQFLLRDGWLELPSSCLESGALEVMQRHLPGVDSRKIVDAMASTRERIFRVWHVEESKWRWSEGVLRERFNSLIARLGGDASGADDVFDRLYAAWGARERRYHDLEHLSDCLREVEGMRGSAPHALPQGAGDRRIADVAELALWYHDAVYAPGVRDAEAQSASLLADDGEVLGLPCERVDAAALCVRATSHLAGAAPSEPLTDLVVDIDLSILGRDPLRFMDFEYGVAEEYAAMPALRYTLARGRFLASLLASPSIFRTAHFCERYEKPARDNLTALLRSPRYRAHRWLGRIYGWLA